MNETGSPPPDSLITLTHVMYGLHAFSALTGMLTPALVVTAFLTGWPSIIAIILNYVKRDEARDSWLLTHFHWQARTFWFALLWLALAGLMVMTVFLIPLAMALLLGMGIWVVYRIVRGWLALLERRALPS